MKPGKDDLWFLPLGGCGEIGMNLNVYGHNGRWLVVDCGVTFQSETDEFGEPITARQPPIQMADPQFLIDRQQQLDGIIITHAHEDHIGAIPYLWEYLRCPVYTTAFTAEMLKRKLIERGIADKVPVNRVNDEAIVSIGEFEVEWLRLTHSIPEPYGLLISTSAGKVFHTADWKLDKAPVVGKPYDAATFRKLAEYQVDAMVCDSTNANVEGWSESEANLYPGLKTHIKNAKARVVVACFGSNIARLHTLARIAEETGRHLGLLGRSLINTVAAAKNVGLWPAVQTSVDSAHLGYLPADKVLLVATGSQGEPRTALNRLSQNSFRDLQLTPGDMVIFSSKIIPGNELAVHALIERLKAMQIDVIDIDNSTVPIHASGHPASEELKMMYQWVQPRCAIPVHGEMLHLNANARIAKASGVKQQLVGQNGDLFYIAPVNGIRRRAVKTGRWGLEDRQKLIKL